VPTLCTERWETHTTFSIRRPASKEGLHQVDEKLKKERKENSSERQDTKRGLTNRLHPDCVPTGFSPPFNKSGQGSCDFGLKYLHLPFVVGLCIGKSLLL